MYLEGILSGGYIAKKYDMRIYSVIFFIIIFGLTYGSLKSQSITLSLDTLRFPAFIWPSEPPADCPFPQSKEFHAIKFVGIKYLTNNICIDITCSRSVKFIRFIPDLTFHLKL